jgi:TRAP-type mannitol/chloroaromatic compound transport system permease small subunit
MSESSIHSELVRREGVSVSLRGIAREGHQASMSDFAGFGLSAPIYVRILARLSLGQDWYWPRAHAILAVTNNRLENGRRFLGDGGALRYLLAFSRQIDWLNERVGQAVYWMVLAAVLVSSGNAVVRYLFDYSSNAWLELQWYLYASFFLIGAGYTLLRNEHVRIDIINSRLSSRTRAWIDLLGGLFFLLPMALLIMALAWPVFTESFALHETSPSANGLLRWPVKLMIPVGFFLLALQGVSEIIKRMAFLMNLIPDPTPHHRHGADDMPLGDLAEGDER